MKSTWEGAGNLKCSVAVVCEEVVKGADPKAKQPVFGMLQKSINIVVLISFSVKRR